MAQGLRSRGMSTINPLALYQIETFGAGFRHRPPRDGHAADAVGGDARSQEKTMRRDQSPRRVPEFLVQLMVGGDSDLRKAIGRKDVAERRVAAYGAALANRPSARPLSFLRVIDSV